MPLLRVIARGDARIPFLGDGGRPEIGRWAGRGYDGKPVAEDVPDLAYYRRAIGHGDLEEAPPAAPDEAPPPADAPNASPPPADPQAPTEP